MLDTSTLKEAAVRAVAGAGLPHDMVYARRREDGLGWVVGFNDGSQPADGAIFEAEFADDAGFDAAVEAMLRAMQAQHREPGVDR